ncbi:MAG TPA: histidine phosphatase family protein, partial [Methylomirabilota bacterium]|nr:histidine phosphatase family protein [Methylomirabilota bacterium]
MRSIYIALIRHAPTAWNNEARVLGQADPPLSPEGARQATRWHLPADLQALSTRGQLGWVVSPLR